MALYLRQILQAGKLYIKCCLLHGLIKVRLVIDIAYLTNFPIITHGEPQCRSWAIVSQVVLSQTIFVLLIEL